MKIIAASTLVLVTLLAGLASPTPATAAGCGGYVNVFVSGCAPWDNNARRMPGAPGYVAPGRQIAPAVQPPRIIVQPQPPQRIVQPTVGNRLVTDNGAGLIGPGNRNPGLLANDGAGLRSGNRILSDQGGGLRR